MNQRIVVSRVYGFEFAIVGIRWQAELQGSHTDSLGNTTWDISRETAWGWTRAGTVRKLHKKIARAKTKTYVIPYP